MIFNSVLQVMSTCFLKNKKINEPVMQQKNAKRESNASKEKEKRFFVLSKNRK